MSLRTVLALFLTAGAAYGAKPVVLAHDDGTQDSRRSIGSDGQAVRFESPGEKFALTAVRIHGSRYGGKYDPFFEVAQVSICDASLKPLVMAHVALEKFPVGNPTWVEVVFTPFLPPKEFLVHVDFFATATKGVYLGIDTGAGGHSITGTIGRPGNALNEGDWMIRVVGTMQTAALTILDPASRKVLSYVTSGRTTSVRCSSKTSPNDWAPPPGRSRTTPAPRVWRVS